MAEKEPASEIAALTEFLSVLDGLLIEAGTPLDVLRGKAAALLRASLGPVRVAVAGEFSSGKSTLVNLLVGDAVIKTSVLASDLPPIVFSHGASHHISAGRWDDSQGVIGPPIDLGAELPEAVDFIRVSTPSEMLRDVEIIDLPGTNDPERDEQLLIDIAGQADILIWCTNAVNAWRESEKHTWSNLPSALRKTGMLVVTHVDLKSVRKSVPRLLARLERETLDKFDAIIPLAAPKAQSATRNGAVEDAEAWAESGGQALWQGLQDQVATARRIAADAAQSFVHEEVAPLLADESSLIYTTADKWQGLQGQWKKRLNDILAQVDQIDDKAFLTLAKTAVTDLSATVKASAPVTAELAWLDTQLAAAAALLNTKTTDGERAALILQQLDGDVVLALQAAPFSQGDILR